MIRGCPGLIHVGKSAQLIDDLTGKIRSLIGVKSGRKPVDSYEFVIQYLGSGMSGLIPSRIRLCIPGVMVCYYQYILISTFARLDAKKIHAYQLHCLRRDYVA